MKTLIWDFDGTLAFSDGLWSGAMVKAITIFDSNHTITKQQLSTYLTKGFPWHTPGMPHHDLSNNNHW